MQTNNINEKTQVASSSSRPQQASAAVSSSDIAAIRDKLKTLEANIPLQEATLDQDETLLGSYQTMDKATLKLENITQQDIDDLNSITSKLKDEVDKFRAEAGSYQLMATVSEYQDYAEKNQSAYETVLTNIAPEVKQEMASDDQHSGLIKEQFKYQVKTGKEAMEFWGDEKNFWDSELKAGPVQTDSKAKLADLYDKVFLLENQINSLFGGSSKDEKDGLKSELSKVKDEVTAVRSRASA